MLSEVFTLVVDGLKIVGQLYLPHDKVKGPFPAVCVCHGIPAHIPDAGNRGYPLLAESICREGFMVLIFNFRGTGDSGGNLDILGWTRDLGAVIDYLGALPELDRSYLSLLGFSGGAAVSVYVASRDRRVSSVVTCACPAEFAFFNQSDRSLVAHFRNIGVIRDEGFPRSIKEWFGGFKLISPIEYIAGIAPRPLLLVHGDHDETVPVGHAHRLYERAGEPKQISIIDGAGHRLRQNDRAMTVVLDWLKSQAKTGLA